MVGWAHVSMQAGTGEPEPGGKPMPMAGPSGVVRTWALRVGKPEGPRGAVYRLPAGERRMGWAPWLVAKAHPSWERWGSERRKGQVVLPVTQAGRMNDGV